MQGGEYWGALQLMNMYKRLFLKGVIFSMERDICRLRDGF